MKVKPTTTRMLGLVLGSLLYPCSVSELVPVPFQLPLRLFDP